MFSCISCVRAWESQFENKTPSDGALYFYFYFFLVTNTFLTDFFSFVGGAGGQSVLLPKHALTLSVGLDLNGL